MSGKTGGYEVLRRFSGGPDGEYQQGQVIDITQIRPTNAASLVELRYLRGVAIDFDPDAERDTWRQRLEPFLAIADHLAFYPQRVDGCFVDHERVRPNEGGFYGGWVTSKVVGPFKGGPGTTGW